MTAVRLVLVALLATVGAVEALAAPAPTPKPRHGNDLTAFGWLKRELRKHDVIVREVTQNGPDEWLVTFHEWRGGCGNGLAENHRCRLPGPDRCAALEYLLAYYRKMDEIRLRDLRARGLIP
jgi:hypothetical protein